MGEKSQKSDQEWSTAGRVCVQVTPSGVPGRSDDRDVSCRTTRTVSRGTFTVLDSRSGVAASTNRTTISHISRPQVWGGVWSRLRRR